MDTDPNFSTQNFTQTPPSTEPSTQNSQTETPKKHSGLRKTLYVLLAILLLAGAAIAGYFYSESQNSEATVTTTTSSNNQTTSAPATSTESFHLIAGQGTVFGSKQVVKSQLALPNFVQSINSPSDNQNPGYIDMLSDKYNDEMGNWLVGDPTLSTDSQVGTITLERIDRAVWKTLKPYEGINSELGKELYEASSASTKDAALNNYASRVKNCSGDESSHYVLSGFFDLCVRLSVAPPQAIDTYLSLIYVEGYGKKDGVELVMLGTVRLESANETTDAVQATLAKEYSQTKKPLKHSVDRANLYRDALQHTTITVEK